MLVSLIRATSNVLWLASTDSISITINSHVTEMTKSVECCNIKMYLQFLFLFLINTAAMITVGIGTVKKRTHRQ